MCHQEEYKIAITSYYLRLAARIIFSSCIMKCLPVTGDMLFNA